jgi:hypothetical protein
MLGRVAGMCWLLLAQLAGCASGSSELRADQARRELQHALQVPVDSKERRDEQSRVLADSVASAELERLDRPRVRALLGPGQACELALCQRHGFGSNDWYYEIGVLQDPQVKQLPLLMLSFDPHQRVTRVFTLTTH